MPTMCIRKGWSFSDKISISLWTTGGTSRAAGDTLICKPPEVLACRWFILCSIVRHQHMQCTPCYCHWAFAFASAHIWHQSFCCAPWKQLMTFSGHILDQLRRAQAKRFRKCQFPLGPILLNQPTSKRVDVRRGLEEFMLKLQIRQRCPSATARVISTAKSLHHRRLPILWELKLISRTFRRIPENNVASIVLRVKIGRKMRHSSRPAVPVHRHYVALIVFHPVVYLQRPFLDSISSRYI